MQILNVIIFELQNDTLHGLHLRVVSLEISQSRCAMITKGVIKDRTELRAREVSKPEISIDRRYCMLFYVANDIAAVLQRILKECKPDVARGETMIDRWAAVNRFVRHREHTMSPTVSIYLAKTADRGHGLIHHAPDAGQRIINGRDAILREYLKRWAEYAFKLHATLNHVGPQASPIQIPGLKQMLHAWVISTPVDSSWILSRRIQIQMSFLFRYKSWQV